MTGRSTDERVSFLFHAQKLRGRLATRLGCVAEQLDLTSTELLGITRLSMATLTVTQLGEAVALHANGASVLVERLVQRGLIQRRRRRDDRRLVDLVITEEGRRLATLARPNLAEEARSFLQPLSEADQHQLAGLLQRLTDS